MREKEFFFLHSGEYSFVGRWRGRGGSLDTSGHRFLSPTPAQCLALSLTGVFFLFRRVFICKQRRGRGVEVLSTPLDTDQRLKNFYTPLEGFPTAVASLLNHFPNTISAITSYLISEMGSTVIVKLLAMEHFSMVVSSSSYLLYVVQFPMIQL